MKKIHKEWYDEYVINQKKEMGKVRMKRLIKKFEEVSIAVAEKGEGFSPNWFFHEIEMPALLKEEMKKEEKNVKSVSC